MDRRYALQLLTTLSGGIALGFNKVNLDVEVLKRTIYSSGEMLPVVGLGTWQTFDVGNDSNARDPLKEVLKELLKQGGSLVDSSPMYGRSEQVIGDLSTELSVNDDLFLATKVWTSGKEEGIRQMSTSMSRMKRSKMDLMQIHNLVDWQTHMKTLRGWKDEGKIRYIGITHYHSGAYSQLEQIMKNEKLDFVQLNYSIDENEAENRLLPLAKDKGINVIINRPFGGGSLFRNTKGKTLPEWAKEFDCSSWAQMFLKYILANEAVTCAIPGTSKPHHMIDNMQAGIGRLPTAKVRGMIRKLFNI